MERIIVLSPLGINRTEAQPPAARLKSLDGVMLGILNNGKPNSLALQEHIASLLGQRFQLAGVVTKKKPSASLAADGLYSFARDVGAVVTAIGDWGSCTSWCIHDSVDLEKLGVPTVTLCTDAFLGLAKDEARALGMPELPLVTIPHPLGGEPPERVRARGEGAVEGVIAALTGAAP